MSIFSNKKTTKNNQNVEIATGQVSVIPSNDKNIFVNNYKTIDILQELNSTYNIIDAIDILINKTADGKMAYNSYLRLANQGIEVEMFNAKTGKPVKKYDNEVRQFCIDIAKNNSAGLDGIIDQLHGSSLSRGGMAVEVVVKEDLSDIEEVVLIDPKTITEFKWLEDKKRYAAYQTNTGSSKKVDLYEGNFFWIPHQPKAGRPDGTLQFEPAVLSVTQYYQLLQDSMAVLNRIGYPHYDVSIDEDKLLASAPSYILADAELRKKLFNDTFTQVKSDMQKMGTNSNIVHFNSIDVNVIGGGVNGSGIDVRAWFEVLDPLVVNSFQVTPVMLGRLSSGSYSLGTAEYKIVTDTVETMRRNSKRMLEEIINLWARVKGYNIKCKVTHNPIDWQKELDKLDAELKRMEKARRAVEYGWIDNDNAAQMGIGAEKAKEKNIDRYEYAKTADENSNNTTQLKENSIENN